MKFLQDRGIQWRGHTIVYPAEQNIPTYLKQKYIDNPNPQQLSQEVLRHTREVCYELRKWSNCLAVDVINEPRKQGRYLFEKSGYQLEKDIYKTAKPILVNKQLFINDWGILDRGGVNMYGEVR